jgi:hypothetical protein
MTDNLPILAFDPERRTNGQAIADLARLGILSNTDRVLDVTIGAEAGFWTKWRPARLVTNDLDPDVIADHHHDGTALPFPAGAFDVVVWDPPYGYRGTSRLASDERYGLRRSYRPAEEIDDLLLAGTAVALRVARRLALVKAQDQNVSGHFRDQTGFVCELARRHGATVAGKVYVDARREQPSGKRQTNVWGYPSTLLVLEVGSGTLKARTTPVPRRRRLSDAIGPTSPPQGRRRLQDAVLGPDAAHGSSAPKAAF